MFIDVLRGLRRNITMAIAMVLTTAISLSLLGAGLVAAQMISKMHDIYGSKVEITIYLDKDISTNDPNCQGEICQSLGDALLADDDIESRSFQSQEQAWQQYQKMFAGQPEMLDIADQSALNASYHVKLVDPERYKSVQARYKYSPGVENVADQAELLDRLFGLLNGVRNATIAVALIQAVAALLLMSNMVQIAAYTRRAETSIMRLVGASRWRTQMPFIFEAVFSALIGAALAIGGLFAIKKFFVDETLGSITNIFPPILAQDLLMVSGVMVGAAVVLAAISSYVTLRLYVRL